MEVVSFFVIVALVVAIILSWILWQLRVISPIKFVCIRIGWLKKYREGEWAGQETGKYTKKTTFGLLSWGYNQKTRHEFIIFNGKVGHKSFQIQTWRPRFAVWGGPVLPWRRPIKTWSGVDPSEARRFQWPHGTQAQLRVYSANHPQRKPAEAYFANSVRRDIEQVRHDEYTNLWLIIDSLKNLKDRRYTHGFHTWVWAITGILGEDTCRAIGKAICEQEHFTIEEGKRLQEKHRKKEAQAYNLPDTASWEEISKARNKAEHMRLAS